MSERDMDVLDLLRVIGDLGLPDHLPASFDRNVRAALDAEIDAAERPRHVRRHWFRRLAQRSLLVPVALICTTAIAAAATGVALGLINLGQAAHRNVLDTPLQLFQADLPAASLPARAGAVQKSLWRQTVIPSSVSMIASQSVPGVGEVQYWVANTTQGGICTALRLPDGSWAGLKDFMQVGGALVGCRPTRAQVSGGALILSGFDYTDSEVLTLSGQELVLNYGEINAPGNPSEVKDEYTGATTSVIDGKYFLLVTHPVRTKSGGFDIDDYTHLIALNSSGKTVADERMPLPGTN
jgi:hypothetical protein